MEILVILHLLKRKWWVVLSAVFIAVGSTLFFTLNQTPVYSATVTYIVSPSPELLEDGSFVGGLSVLSGQTSITNTYASIVTSTAVRKDAVTALGLNQQQNSRLSLNSRVRSGTNVIEITAEGNDPLTVQAFANRIGYSTEEYVNRLYEVYDMIILDSASFPEKPVWPNIPFNLVMALTLGLVLGGSLVLIESVKFL